MSPDIEFWKGEAMALCRKI